MPIWEQTITPKRLLEILSDAEIEQASGGAASADFHIIPRFPPIHGLHRLPPFPSPIVHPISGGLPEARQN